MKEVIMRIKSIFVLGLLFASSPAFAMEGMDDHGSAVFHMFRLETDYGGGKNGAVATWDLDGWIGTDENKFWLKSEGAHTDGKLEDAEFWALYSRNISTFWDAQIGLRHDTRPVSTSYLTLGVNGLAPYFFETEAHLFVSDKGDISARLREENDFLVTQKLILQPYAEINLFAQDVPEQDIGAGVSSGEIGLQSRYEITRKFAPYIDVRYERKFGETSSIAKSNGENNDDFIGSVGLRLMF
jgi:copper resistance protein B